MENQFKIGQKVYLASGSPPLYVSHINNNKVSVSWQDGKNSLSLAGECFVSNDPAISSLIVS